MRTVNMHEAKTQLSKLVAMAVAGEPFVIAKAGKPLVKVIPVEEPEPKPKPQRIGFAKGRWTVPDAEAWAEMDREVLQMFDENPWINPGEAAPRDAGR